MHIHHKSCMLPRGCNVAVLFFFNFICNTATHILWWKRMYKVRPPPPPPLSFCSIVSLSSHMCGAAAFLSTAYYMNISFKFQTKSHYLLYIYKNKTNLYHPPPRAAITNNVTHAAKHTRVCARSFSSSPRVFFFLIRVYLCMRCCTHLALRALLLCFASLHGGC